MHSLLNYNQIQLCRPPLEFLEGDEILGEENNQSSLGVAELDELYEDVSAVYNANATKNSDLDIGHTPDSEPGNIEDHLDQSNATFNQSTNFDQSNDVFDHSVVATDESVVDLLAQSGVFTKDHESSDEVHESPTHDESMNSSSHTQANMEATSKVMNMINSVRNIPVQISGSASFTGDAKLFFKSNICQHNVLLFFN